MGVIWVAKQSNHQSSILQEGQTRPLSVYFRSILNTIYYYKWKKVDGVHGIRTRDHTELHPRYFTEMLLRILNKIIASNKPDCFCFLMILKA